MRTSVLDRPVAGERGARDAEPGAAGPAMAPEAVAVAAGVARGSVTGVADLSRSHWLHRVTAPGGDVVVKQARAALLAGGRTLDHETFVYRLSGWIGPLRDVLPQVRLVDEANQVLVLEALDPVAWGPHADGAAVGTAVAQVHLATADVPVPFGTNDGVLVLADATDDDLLLGGEGRRLAEELRADDRVTGLLDAARASVVPACLVHGDLKWDNVLTAPGPPGGVRLIDWELSGRGDPAWDVASWLVHAVALGDRAGDCAADFVRAYAQDAGADDALWVRAARQCPARAVHLALEAAEGGGDPAPMVAIATDLADRADDVAAVLAGWAAP
jgi:hypothetical protein